MCRWAKPISCSEWSASPMVLRLVNTAVTPRLFKYHLTGEHLVHGIPVVRLQQVGDRDHHHHVGVEPRPGPAWLPGALLDPGSWAGRSETATVPCRPSGRDGSLRPPLWVAVFLLSVVMTRHGVCFIAGHLGYIDTSPV
jgi:hypothetical protein